MDKNFFRTLKLLAVVAVLYTLLVLIIPFAKTGVFWLSYVYTMVALFAQAYIQQLAYRKRKPVQSKYYKLSLARVGGLYLAVQFGLGLLMMILSTAVPLLLPLVLYLLILAAAAVGTIAMPTLRPTAAQELPE